MSEKSIEALVTIPLSDKLVEELQQISGQVNFHFQTAENADQIDDEVWSQCEVLLSDKVFPTLEQAPRLSWVQLFSSCIEKALPHPIFENHNVHLTTLSGADAPQTAEYVLQALLTLGHNTPQILQIQQEGKWDEEYRQDHQPLELRGSTVGILGYGSLGREIARLLQPFNIKVLAAKKNVMIPADKGYTIDGLGDPGGELFHRLYPIQAVKSMIRECDFVVICLPLTSQTKDLFGEDEFDAMKESACLVNVSCGGVVNSNALINALRKKQISGAYLDVFPEEPLSENSSYWKLPNTILSPHIAANSRFFEERAVELFKENLKRYLNGNPLLNLVDFEQGY